MTLDYMHCKKDFVDVVKAYPEIKEMIKENEGWETSHNTDKCECINKKTGKECGKEAYALIKFKHNEDDGMYVVDAYRMKTTWVIKN